MLTLVFFLVIDFSYYEVKKTYLCIKANNIEINNSNVEIKPIVSDNISKCFINKIMTIPAQYGIILYTAMQGE